MKISEHYGIQGDQSTLDFVDVKAKGDVALFIDPSVISSIDSPWTDECTFTIQTYFQAVLDKIVAQDEDGARALLSQLGEDNSTRLGYSDSSEGSGVGRYLADKFYNELSTSQAVESGLITDIEDTALLIEGVREDRISDVVTNIIRKQLIDYTQQTADFYKIPLVPNVAINPYWDATDRRWISNQVFDLPIAEHEPLLLVPKSIVRRLLRYSPSEYYRYHVLAYFQSDELAKGSPLVQTLKSGEKRVTKRSVEAKYKQKHDNGGRPGVEKRINLDASSRNPELLASYKEAKRNNPPDAVSHETLAKATSTPLPDYDDLLQAVRSIPQGINDSDRYERAVEALLTALLYPALVNPVRQSRQHEGRKRIDIKYTNMAREGFFCWLSANYPAPHVMVECKNYSRDLSNPEYDQIAGRFSPSRGKYGLLVYRECTDKERIMLSLRDTANDDRGYITALDDEDLSQLVQEAKADEGCAALNGLLHKQFLKLIE